VSASKRWSEGALEPVVAGDEANAEEREESRIGYGSPPVATRFRKGVSGNPRGRPKGARNIATVVAATLGERISITENGRRKRITKLDAAVKQLVNRAAGGDARSLQLLLGLVQAIEARPAPSDPQQPSEADREVIRDVLRRMSETSS
jgi:uncharacterized protein DUF5681